MDTLVPPALLAYPAGTAAADPGSVEALAISDGATRALLLVLVVILVALALRAVARTLAPIADLVRTFVSASLAAVLVLVALLLVAVVAVGSV